MAYRPKAEILARVEREYTGRTITMQDIRYSEMLPILQAAVDSDERIEKYVAGLGRFALSSLFGAMDQAAINSADKYTVR